MPRGNGTGPLGEGPMTGRGMGFCILKKEDKDQNQIVGFIGIEGNPYRETIQKGKGGTVMRGGNAMPEVGQGTRPAGMGQMTRRAVGYCAEYPIPGYIDPIPGHAAWRYGWPTSYRPAVFRFVPYTPTTVAPYAVYLRTVWRLGRGRGRGRGFRY